MSILLRSDDRDGQSDKGVLNNSPLGRYAAEHWVAHAQFEHVSSYLRTSMESLFDLDKPYFVAWLKLYDIDTRPPGDSTFFMFTPTSKRGGSPLYYAALCGFQNLVEKLIAKYPQHVNSHGGWYLTPLVAALAGKQFQTAELLRYSGADPDIQCHDGFTPLHSATCFRDVEMVQELLDLRADFNIRDNYGKTILESACSGLSSCDKVPNYPQSLVNIARLLLDRGADINARNGRGGTPLHSATRIEVIRVLLERGANVNGKDKQGRTPFKLAKERGHNEIMKLLLEHGAE